MKVVIIAGSDKDFDHVQQIYNPLLEVEIKQIVCSAHKNPQRLLDLLKTFDDEKHVIFVTVAGRSNALSGMVAANTKHTVIACPVFASTADYMADIHSTLRMPSNVPVLTILSPENCVLAVKRILNSWKE